MEFNTKNIIPMIKHIFSRKKTKITLYIVMVLWIATMTQILVNQLFYKELKITDAFVSTKMTGMESNIEVVGEFKSEFLSENDKSDLIQAIGRHIGLTMDQDITVWKEATRSIYSFTKEAKQAKSEIKVVSLEQEEDNSIVMKHYVLVRLNLKETIASIDQYRGMITDILDELEVENQQVTLKYKGEYEGVLSRADKDELSNNLVKQLRGTISTQYEEDLYTVYAYTALLDEYIMNGGTKVNIQIAISYDEEKNKTVVYLASPLLNDSW